MIWKKTAEILLYALVFVCFLVLPGWQREKELPASGRGVPAEPRKIALTFDDGPSPVWTPVLLDGLKERKAHGTFFLLGESVSENPRIVERMAKEGHLIGNHTYHHVRLDEISDEEAKKEIRDTDRLIYGITGKHTAYVRPPFGIWKEELGRELEVLPVMWNIDPLDWCTSNTDEIVEKVVTDARENAIILLHDCYESSVQAAFQIIDGLTKEGYQFVTVDELLMD